MKHPIFVLYQHLGNKQAKIWLSISLSCANKFFDIFPEILIGMAVDIVVHRQSSFLGELGLGDANNQLGFLALLIVVTWLLESTFDYLKTISWRSLGQYVQHELRLQTYQHVQNLPSESLISTRMGHLLSILSEDINQLETFFDEVADRIIQTFVSSLFICLAFLIMAPGITLWVILPVPLILFGSFYFQHHLGKHFSAIRQQASIVNSELENNLRGLMTIKAFGKEEQQSQLLWQHSDNYRQTSEKAVRLSAMVTPIIRLAVLIGFLATMLFGAFAALQDQLSIGAFSVLVFWTQRLLWPLTSLAQITINYQKAMASASRILSLDSHNSIPRKTPSDSDAITLNNVSFSYQNGHQALNNLSYHFDSKKAYAIVGTSGSGKSTLIKILLGLLTPTSGERLIGNSKDSLPLIGYVGQEPYLFHGSIKDNILFGEAFDEAHFTWVLNATACHFVEQLPQGSHTLIHDGGHGLSGGQKQRIALARALYRKPQILMLDEVSSALDQQTSSLITKTLSQLKHQLTIIAITHQLRLTQTFDEIIVLEQGHLIAQGNHAFLMKNSDAYQKLYHSKTVETDL